jgi:diaminopimelate epimerase
MSIPFVKMAGCGNDFVIVESADIPQGMDVRALARMACRQGTGIGADGLVVIDRAPVGDAHFSVTIVNRSGLEAEMCGNAARCIARLAVERGIAADQHVFRTVAGNIGAKVADNMISIRLTEPSALQRNIEVAIEGEAWLVDFIDTGVPHAILWCEDAESMPVESLGRAIRHWRGFPCGANVNFVSVQCGKLRMRTFERGVEAETLACGTGAAASGISAAYRNLVRPPVSVITTEGSELTVDFDLRGDLAANVTLSGPAMHICEGAFTDEWISAIG